MKSTFITDRERSMQECSPSGIEGQRRLGLDCSKLSSKPFDPAAIPLLAASRNPVVPVMHAGVADKQQPWLLFALAGFQLSFSRKLRSFSEREG